MPKYWYLQISFLIFAAGGMPDSNFTGGVMNNLNSILIEGNLVRDPLLRSTSKGTQICTFTLASNRFFRQDTGLEKEVGFFDVESWAKLGESCYSQGHKGRGVRVVGRLKQNRWNGTDGKSYSKICIVAEHVEFRPEAKKGGYAAQRPSLAANATEGDFDSDCAPDMEEELEPVTF
jgi:single-strand DNA-binding protein